MCFSFLFVVVVAFCIFRIYFKEVFLSSDVVLLDSSLSNNICHIVKNNGKFYVESPDTWPSNLTCSRRCYFL